MAEYITNGQSNYGWSLTWDAAGRYPIIAKRRFPTLADAQAFVDDFSTTATATEGLILSVINDTVAKNNGVYYIASVAMAEGENGKLVKVGGAETETAADYAAAVELSKTLVVGQLIKVEAEYKDEENDVTYQKGFYIVEGAGVISALATSTGSDDEVGALKARVDAAEVDIQVLEEAVAAIEIPEVPVKDVTVGGVSVLGEDGVAAIEIPEVPVKDVTVGGVSVLGEDGVAAIELGSYETIENVDKVREDVLANAEAIEALQGKDAEFAEAVEALQGKDAEFAEAVEALEAKDTELAEAIAKKVEKVDGERLMTDAEGAKLEGIEEGAEVNVIEVVKVNGQALTVAAADRSVDVIIPTAPVQGVAEGEKIISLDGDKLKSTLTLAYVPATEDANAVLRLQGINGEVVSSIDATAFVKDGMLSGAKLEGPKDGETGEKYLVLSFNTEAGKEDVRMDVTSLLDYYTAGDGLTLTGNSFAVKLDTTANAYLQITTNGIAVSQAFLDKITELDNAVLTAAQEYVNTKVDGKFDTLGSAATALGEAKTYADETFEKIGVAEAKAGEALEEAKTYADETFEKIGVAEAKAGEVKTYADETFEKIGVAAEEAAAVKTYADETFEKIGVAEAKAGEVKTYADETFVKLEGFNEFAESMETKLEGIEEGAQVNVIEAVKVNGVDAVVADKVAEVKIEADDIELGAAITADGEEVYGATQKLSSVLQGIQDSISVAVSGGLTGVVGGNGIEVSAVSANKQTVSAKVSAAEGNLISVDENGLFAAMYFDGDDQE